MKIRARIINLFIFSLVIVSVLNLYRKNIFTTLKTIKNTPRGDEMQKDEKRYQEIKNHIPQGEIVGYVGENDSEFHKAQFFLVPNLLDAEKTKRKYILVKIYPNSKNQLKKYPNYKKVMGKGNLFLLKKSL